MARSGEQGRCPRCRAWMGVYVPKGGDGSMVVLRPHNDAPGVRCKGSGREPVESREAR